MKRRRQRTAHNCWSTDSPYITRRGAFLQSPDIHLHLPASIRTKTASLACSIHTTGSAFSEDTLLVCLRQNREETDLHRLPSGASALRTCCSGGGGRKYPCSAAEACRVPQEAARAGGRGRGAAPGAERAAAGGAPGPPLSLLTAGACPVARCSGYRSPPRPRRPRRPLESIRPPVLPFVFSPSSSSKGQARSGLEQAGRPGARPPGPPPGLASREEPKS